MFFATFMFSHVFHFDSLFFSPFPSSIKSHHQIDITLIHSLTLFVRARHCWRWFQFHWKLKSRANTREWGGWWLGGLKGRRWRKEKRLSLDGEEKTTHTLFHAFLWIYNSLEVHETGDETWECGRSLNNSSQNIFVVYHISLPHYTRLPSCGGAKKLLFCFNPVWQMNPMHFSCCRCTTLP